MTAVAARKRFNGAGAPTGNRITANSFEEIIMNHIVFASALLAALSLAACDKPTVVNVPTPVVTPGPAGATGATGATGGEGATGATGKTGDGSTVIVMPPAASAPSN